MAYLKKITVVRWLDPETKRRVKKEFSGAIKVKERSSRWYAFGLPGQTKPIPCFENKVASQARLAELLHKAERGEAGLVDEVQKNKVKELIETLEEFIGLIESRGKTSKTQIKLIKTRLNQVFTGCGWKIIRDLNGDQASSYLADRRIKTRAQGGLSIQTSNYYIVHLKMFGAYLLKKKLARENPFEDLTILNPAVDRKHARRDLTDEEVGQLLQTCNASKTFWRGLSGKQRGQIYLLAMATGFRSGELASLTPRHFDLDSFPPAVRLAKRQTKNKRGSDGQPLPEVMVPMLREWLEGLDPTAPVWPGNWREKAAQMLKADLESCSPPIPYVIDGIDGPEYADLHSLRHYYVTAMARSSSLTVAQLAARHGSINVTQRYNHTRNEEIAAAVNLLPLPLKVNDKRTANQESSTTLEVYIAKLVLLEQLVEMLLPGINLSFLGNPAGNQNIKLP